MTTCPIETYTFYRGSHTHYLKLKTDAKPIRASGGSNWGKQIESQDAIERWKRVNCLKGSAADPSLLRAFANATERDEQDELMEKMMQAAKANEGRDYGSDAHRVTELYDKGQLSYEDEFTLGIVGRWTKVLEAAGIEIVAQHVERVAILPEWRVCAIFDRLARYKGKLYVVDLKTGKGGISYPHTMAVQLALISRCTWVTKGEGEPYGKGGRTWTEFEPMPPVEQSTGLIVSLPKEDG